MIITKAEIYPLKIPFNSDFSIARGKVGGAGLQREIVLVKLTDEDGHVGWGEGSPSAIWSYETIESVVSTLENYLLPAVVGLPDMNLDRLHREMNRVPGPSQTVGHPIAKCAVDMALHDLIGRRLRLSIGQMWGMERTKEATLSWTVSTTELKLAEEQVKNGLDKGYSNFNIKLGVKPEQDVQLCELVKTLAPDGFLWGDANGGYNYHQLIERIASLEDAGLDLLEQPFPSNRHSMWRELKRKVRIPLAVDEAIITPVDLMEFIRFDLISAFAAKVTRNGGLLPSRQCAELAEFAGLLTVSSGLTDTGLAMAANLHIVCAFGIELPCAWNGPQFLEEDLLLNPLVVKNGKVTLPDGPGLGVQVDQEKVNFLMKRNQFNCISVPSS